MGMDTSSIASVASATSLSDPRQPGRVQDTRSAVFPPPTPGSSSLTTSTGMFLNGDATRGHPGQPSRSPQINNHNSNSNNNNNNNNTGAISSQQPQHHLQRHQTAHENGYPGASPPPVAEAPRRFSTSHSDSLRGPGFDDITTHDSQSSGHLTRPPVSAGNSQESGTNTNDTGSVFTPSTSQGGMSSSGYGQGSGTGIGGGQESSQDSQLLRLSHVVSAQGKLSEDDDPLSGGLSRKRMADGAVKHARSKSAVSPLRGAGRHSRNTSTASVASTSGSRIGDLSAELKARLSYAMVKVSNGWHSHSIDQVENLASQAASPASSTSTIHLRHGSSASPQPSISSIQTSSNNSAPTTATSQHFPRLHPHTSESGWKESPLARPRELDSPSSPLKSTQTLAPPVSIQPSSQYAQNPRRNSTFRHAPPLVSSQSHPGASPSTAPHTPGHPSPYPSSDQRTPVADPILFSPHPTPQQAVREQDAMEALLFMSSPGNSANLKHTFPSSSSQPLPSSRAGPQRTALPGSQPRKSLPSGRPGAHHGHSHSYSQSHSQPTPKRVGFETSPVSFPADMDIDDPLITSPDVRNTPTRKQNGGSGPFGTESFQHHHQLHGNRNYAAAGGSASRFKQFQPSAGLSGPTRSRPALADEDIDRMLDRAADESSDSEGEIQIPVSKERREGIHAVVHA